MIEISVPVVNASPYVDVVVGVGLNTVAASLLTTKVFIPVVKELVAVEVRYVGLLSAINVQAPAITA
jgi:hypothetical protein